MFSDGFTDLRMNHQAGQGVGVDIPHLAGSRLGVCGDHLVAGRQDARPRPPHDLWLRDAEGREEPDVLGPQAMRRREQEVDTMPDSTDAGRAAPRLEIVPADAARDLCPTLLLDGQTLHDPVQPYGDVLSLEGKRPAVIALFGVGLGYTVAGALRLCPTARVVAWEPLTEMASIARRMLADEWRLSDSAPVETDLIGHGHENRILFGTA